MEMEGFFRGGEGGWGCGVSVEWNACVRWFWGIVLLRGSVVSSCCVGRWSRLAVCVGGVVFAACVGGVFFSACVGGVPLLRGESGGCVCLLFAFAFAFAGEGEGEKCFL